MAYPLFDALQQPGFKGAPFDIEDVDDQLGQALAVHEYPNRPGGDVECLGRKAREMRVRAVFTGMLGLQRRDALLAKLEESGVGDLVHPVFGTIKAAFKDGSLRHNHRGRDYAEMEMTFIEDSTKATAFQQTANTANQQAQQSLALARQAWQGFGF